MHCSKLWRSDVQHRCHLAKIKVLLARLCSFLVTLGDNLFICLFKLEEVTHIPWSVGLTLSLPDQQCYISLTFLPQSPFSLTVTQNISSHSAAHGMSLCPSGSYTTISSSLFPQIHHIYKVLFAM